jgi:hypothetical protein
MAHDVLEGGKRQPLLNGSLQVGNSQDLLSQYLSAAEILADLQYIGVTGHDNPRVVHLGRI